VTAVASFPAAAAVSSRGGFYVQWDTLYMLYLPSGTGFLKLWYAYNQWYASHCLVVHGHSEKKSKDKKNTFFFNKCSYTEELIKLLFI
jgi:hypothetical protein